MDVSIRTPRDAREVLSPLMQAKARLKTGERAFACPFGCADGKTDENGYCRHLIGFTNSSEAECKAGKGLFEPMIRDKDGRRKVMVKRKLVARTPGYEDDDEEGEIEAGEPILEKVLPSDILVRITVSSRVYRDVKKPEKKAEAKAEAKA